MTDKRIISDGYTKITYYPDVNVLEFTEKIEFNLDHVEDVNNLRDLFEFLRDFFETVMGE